jgi:hypothetical protein
MRPAGFLSPLTETHMGYYVTLTNVIIDIPKSDFPRICNHLLDTGFLTDTSSMNGGSYTDGGKTESWYSWVDMKALARNLNAGDLHAVLENFGFDVFTDKDTGAIIDLGYDNKTGNEEELFKAMSPVLPGTTELFWSGECGARWKWKIAKGKFKIIDAVTTYPEE